MRFPVAKFIELHRSIYWLRTCWNTVRKIKHTHSLTIHSAHES